MIALPPGILAHINDDPYIGCHLIEIQGSVTHYWTDFTSDVVYAGHTYTHAIPFQVGQIVTDAEGMQAVTLVLSDESQLVQGYDLSEGMQDRVIRIHEAWMASDGSVIDVYTDLVKGRTAGIEFDEESSSNATLSVNPSYAPMNQTGPRNSYEPTCVNGYKDLRCKYAGGLATCLRTYTDCVAHANTINFRGCRHALLPPATVAWGGTSGGTTGGGGTATTVLTQRPAAYGPLGKPRSVRH